MADPAREWWQQPLYIEMESPRTYVDLVAPDPAPVVQTTLTSVKPLRPPPPVAVEYEVIHPPPVVVEYEP